MTSCGKSFLSATADIRPWVLVVGVCPQADRASIMVHVAARAQAKTETLLALGKPGVKVCRALPVGIAVRDWIRGEVMQVNADRISVRIDDPGRQPHVIDDRPLVKGMTIWSAATEWTPCL